MAKVRDPTKQRVSLWIDVNVIEEFKKFMDRMNRITPSKVTMSMIVEESLINILYKEKKND